MNSYDDCDDIPIVIIPDAEERDEKENGEASAPSTGGIGRPSGNEAAPPPTAGPLPTPRRIQQKVLLRRCLYVAGSCLALIVVAVGSMVAYLVMDGGYIAAYYPSPGRLSSAHHQLSEGTKAFDCNSCHALAGISSGCLGCHEEIAGQLKGQHGFHHYLFQKNERQCTACHREHRGPESSLVDEGSWPGQGRNDFRHSHVVFRLTGRHLALECRACHEGKLGSAFTLPKFPEHPRQHTFLGLDQECVSCHEDIHSGGLSKDCESCHDQNAFRPAALFDHSRHFALEGGHSRVACNQCHPPPEPDEPTRVPFAEARGTRCAECHSSPHRSVFEADCQSCHGESPDSWSEGRSGVTLEVHGTTGFNLLPQHTEVDCVKCHEPGRSYEERFPDPSVPGYVRFENTCQGCHRGVHGGQFLGKALACLDCHDRQKFEPHRFTLERHASAYPLVDAHARAQCESCHAKEVKTGVRVFVGTPRDCQSCHENPHGEQFITKSKGCPDCHGTKRFLPARFDLAMHETVFPLTGSHRAAPCVTCHVREQATTARQFVGTPGDCKTCHENPHGDQFANELAAGDCTACHSDRSDTFAISTFDHEKRAGYALTGAHATAKCNECHVVTEEATASGVAPARLYRGTPTECSWCHRDVHRGQFQERGETECKRCHVSTRRWAEIRFDHRLTRFPLDGSHVSVACARCHPSVELDDGNAMTWFKPLGMECNDCHEIQSQR